MENNSSDDGKAGHAEWIYRMADPSNGETHFYYSDLNDAPLLARSNFQPVNRWIWEVERKGDKAQFQSEFIWTNGKSEGQVNCAWIKTEAAKHNNWETRRVSFFVPLKMPPLTVVDKSELEFKKNGRNADRKTRIRLRLGSVERRGMVRSDGGIRRRDGLERRDAPHHRRPERRRREPRNDGHDKGHGRKHLHNKGVPVTVLSQTNAARRTE